MLTTGCDHITTSCESFGSRRKKAPQLAARDLKSPLHDLPEINPVRGVHIRRHYGYYDGVLSGLLRWEGNLYYFNCADEVWWEGGWYDEADEGEEPDPTIDWNRTRYFACYPLSPDQWKPLLKRDYLFRKYVGRHTQYRKSGGRDIGSCKAQGTWDLFYKEERPKELIEMAGDLKRNGPKFRFT